jgi:outer membrane receptor protein involved in Fe transport
MRNPQTTLEIRASAPTLGGFFGLPTAFGAPLGETEFMAGFFHQTDAIADGRFDFVLNDTLVGAFLAAQNAPPGTVQATGPRLAESDSDVIERMNGFFDQRRRTIAGFGQAEWRFLDEWTLTFGLRIQADRKEAKWKHTFETNGTLGVAPLLQGSGFEEFETSRRRSELQFAPRVNLQYAWSDLATFYTTWARGFRHGGFQGELATTAEPQFLEFDDEGVKSIELGAKTTLLDGTARFDVALFRMDLTGAQIGSLQPTGPPLNSNVGIVVNADEARSQGVEADLDWLPTDWLTIRAALGFNDTEYVDFKLGPCLPGSLDSDGDGDPRCDLTGDPLARAPKWSGAITGILDVPLRSIPAVERLAPTWLRDLALSGGPSVLYQDTHFFSAHDDPGLRNPSSIRVDAGMGIGDPTRGWHLKFGAKNLTEENITTYGQELITTTDDSVVGSQELDPRLFLAELRWEF